MKLNVQKWGNSAAIRLPAAVLAQMGAKVGDVFEMELKGDEASIRLAKPKYTLAQLLAEMPEGLPRVPGWDAMPDVGKEQC